MLLDTIREDLVAAMKAKDETTVRTLRSVVAAVQEAEVAGARATKLDEAAVEAVVAKQAKRRIEAAEAFEAGGATERAAGERAEFAILDRYLPDALSSAELAELVTKTLGDGGFTTRAQMGQAMKAVNAVVAGRADGRAVADLVKSQLS